MRRNVKLADKLPRTIRTHEERQLWIAAIRSSSCKCEYCVWGVYLDLLYRARMASNAVRLSQPRKARKRGVRGETGRQEDYDVGDQDAGETGAD
jgi:hypothetical protein